MHIKPYISYFNVSKYSVKHFNCLLPITSSCSRRYAFQVRLKDINTPNDLTLKSKGDDELCRHILN